MPDGAPQNVTLVVYDVAGARVRPSWSTGGRTPGLHSVVWDGRDSNGNTVGTGVYFYRMRQAGVTETKKMILLK